MIKFFEHLRGVLSRDARFIDADGEKLLRNKISEAATLYDEKLLTLLLADEKTRETFFTDAAGVTVFKQRDFVQVVNGHEFLANSYTRFANKIGLVDEHDRFVSRTGNVALVFPYKDCVLEGGQTKDDQKRDEIFYNTTLAHDELDRLLAPKVFTNAVRYDEHGATPATDFSDADNLIVKGNNLLALASLAERFSGKVKAIYLDPPYNTGSDGFNYNDSFNHSTWLTFMTNRLTLARQLLADDGSIWISIDDDEQAYLKVLADEIFKRDNFVATVIWEKNIRRKTTQRGSPTVTILFWFTRRTKPAGVRISCRAPKKWTPATATLTTTRAARGLQAIFPRELTAQAAIIRLRRRAAELSIRRQRVRGLQTKQNFWNSLPTIEFGLAKTETTCLA